MKTLAILVSLAFATPVFACPHEDGEAPKTAEKAKDTKGTKAKDAPKKAEGTATAKKKDEPKQDTAKKPDKVSQK